MLAYPAHPLCFFCHWLFQAYLDTVRRQEQNPLEVLELSQEDADEGIPVDVMHVALLQEDIGFVKQEDGAPGVADIQYLLELALEEPRVGAELTGRRHVQRAFEQFRDALSRQRFACAGRPVEDSCYKVSRSIQQTRGCVNIPTRPLPLP